MHCSIVTRRNARRDFSIVQNEEKLEQLPAVSQENSPTFQDPQD